MGKDWTVKNEVGGIAYKGSIMHKRENHSRINSRSEPGDNCNQNVDKKRK